MPRWQSVQITELLRITNSKFVARINKNNHWSYVIKSRYIEYIWSINNHGMLTAAANGTFSVLVGDTVSTERRAARAAAARNSALSDVVVNRPLTSLKAHSVMIREHWTEKTRFKLDKVKYYILLIQTSFIHHHLTYSTCTCNHACTIARKHTTQDLSTCARLWCVDYSGCFMVGCLSWPQPYLHLNAWGLNFNRLLFLLIKQQETTRCYAKIIPGVSYWAQNSCCRIIPLAMTW